MKWTISYSNIERITYEFDQYDIENALKLLIEKAIPNKNIEVGKWNFEFKYGDEGDICGAKLIQSFETKSDEP